MPVHLLPCPGCARHVRAGEAQCPFCLASIGDATAPAPPTPIARLGRSATFAFGAAVAATIQVTGCSSPTTPGGTDSGIREDAGAVDAQMAESDAGAEPVDGGPAPLYGGPPTDSGPEGVDAGSGSDVDGGGGPAPAYGAPPSDAGPMAQEDAGGGGPVPLYGAPPMSE